MTEDEIRGLLDAFDAFIPALSAKMEDPAFITPQGKALAERKAKLMEDDYVGHLQTLAGATTVDEIGKAIAGLVDLQLQCLKGNVDLEDIAACWPEDFRTQAMLDLAKKLDAACLAGVIEKAIELDDDLGPTPPPAGPSAPPPSGPSLR